jgi:hypothetical protein
MTTLLNSLLIAALFTHFSSLTGAVQIKTDAVGAAVFLDGESRGFTPLTLSNMAVGNHELRLHKEGFLDSTRSITVKEQEILRLFIVLEAEPRPLAALPRGFPVLHLHTTGMCIGTLTVAEDGIHYRAYDQRDVFDIPWSAMDVVTRGGLYDTRESFVGEYCGLRIDSADRNYSFLAYEETPEVAKAPVDKRGKMITLEMASKPTGELFDLVWRIWLPKFKAK